MVFETAYHASSGTPPQHHIILLTYSNEERQTQCVVMTTALALNTLWTLLITTLLARSWLRCLSCPGCSDWYRRAGSVTGGVYARRSAIKNDRSFDLPVIPACLSLRLSSHQSWPRVSTYICPPPGKSSPSKWFGIGKAVRGEDLGRG